MTNMFRATPAHVQPSSSVSGVRYLGTEGAPPLVAHVIHRLSVGGLENGLVNLINHMPAGRYSHAIICLAGYDDFSKRIQRSEALVYDLRKSEGHDVRAYMRLWSLLRRLKPAILHTRTQGTLDSQIYGLLAGVRLRVHGEHGQIRSDTAGAPVYGCQRRIGTVADTYRRATPEGHPYSKRRRHHPVLSARSRATTFTWGIAPPFQRTSDWNRWTYAARKGSTHACPSIPSHTERCAGGTLTPAPNASGRRPTSSRSTRDPASGSSSRSRLGTRRALRYSGYP